MLGPKVDAGWLLHELTADLPAVRLRAVLLGRRRARHAGQAGYAAANVVPGRAGAAPAGAGLPGGVDRLGPVGAADRDDRRAGTGGQGPARRRRLADAAEGLALLDAALAATGPVLARWTSPRCGPGPGAGGDIPAVLRGLPVPAGGRPRPSARPAPAGPDGPPAARPRRPADRAGPGRRRDGVLDLVRAQVAAVLGHGRPAAVDADGAVPRARARLADGVELRNRLGPSTGLRLPATLVFNQPTVFGLSDYLLGELVPAPPAPDLVLRQALDQVTGQLDGADAEPDERDRVLAVLQAAVVPARRGAARRPGGGIDLGFGRGDVPVHRQSTLIGRSPTGPGPPPAPGRPPGPPRILRRDHDYGVVAAPPADGRQPRRYRRISAGYTTRCRNGRIARHVGRPECPVRLDQNGHLTVVPTGPSGTQLRCITAVHGLVGELGHPFIVGQIDRGERETRDVRTGAVAQVGRQPVAQRRRAIADSRAGAVQPEHLPELLPDRPQQRLARPEPCDGSVDAKSATSRGKSSGPPGVGSAHTSRTVKSGAISWIRQGREVCAEAGILMTLAREVDADKPCGHFAYLHGRSGYEL